MLHVVEEQLSKSMLRFTEKLNEYLYCWLLLCPMSEHLTVRTEDVWWIFKLKNHKRCLRNLARSFRQKNRPPCNRLIDVEDEDGVEYVVNLNEAFKWPIKYTGEIKTDKDREEEQIL